jgi:hypothetical protein
MGKKGSLVGLVLALLASAAAAQTQPPPAPEPPPAPMSIPPMISVGDYRDLFLKLSETRTQSQVQTLKIMYVRGVVEGAYFTEYKGDTLDEEALRDKLFMHRCLEKLQNWLNVVVLFDKWIEEHPGATSDPAAMRLLRRTQSWCRNNGVE